MADMNNSSAQASDNSVAVGSISVGHSIDGSLVIGNSNVIGFTSDQVSTLITQISTTFQVKPFDGRCPYKGLETFGEEDAELFFGREQWVKNLMGRVKESRTLFVTGQSGSGKSSLVRAGLIPTLKKAGYGEHWLYATMKPGRDPIDALATAFSRLKDPGLGKYLRENANSASTLHECAESVLSERTDQRLVLYLDQFEEVFTQLSKDKAQTFINLLAHAATVENGRVIILFSMRSDFVPNCATYPQLNDLLNQQFVQIGAMQPEELVSAIAQPALRVGLKIDPDLIAQIINDMKGEPGALPLMQFALKDLFDAEQAKGGMIALTLSDYLEHGGINQALERHANASLEQLTDSEKELARSIFSGLIEIGRGTQDTRRTALANELIPAGTQADAVKAVVQKLASARLITTDATTVTISHEKLIDAWPWLKKLVNENRDVIAMQNEIAADAKEWEEHKRDASYLYSGARLVNANEQLKSKKLVLSGTALAYIRAGQARQRQSRAALIGAISTLIALLMFAVVIFSRQSSENAQQANENATQAAQNKELALKNDEIAKTAQAASTLAVEQSNIVLARQIMTLARSINPMSSRQPIAILLAIQSMKISPTGDGAELLVNENFSIKPFHRMQLDGTVNIVKFGPDNEYLASGGCDKVDENKDCLEGYVRIWSVITGKEINHIIHKGNVNSIDFSPDGKYILSAGANNILISEVETGNLVSQLPFSGWVSSVKFSPNGKYIASGSSDKTTRVWDATTKQEVARINHQGPVFTVAFAPNSNSIISGSGDKTAVLWDLIDNKQISQINLGSVVTSSQFSRSGKYIALGGADGTVLVWKAEEEVLRVEHEQLVSSLAFSPDEEFLVSGSYDGTARVFDITKALEVSRMTHENIVTSVAYNPDGLYVVSGSSDFTARVWSAVTGQEISRITKNSIVVTTDFSLDGKYVVAGGNDGYIDIWESPTSTESLQNQIKHSSQVQFSSSGNYVAILDSLQNLSVWNRISNEKIYNASNPSHFFNLEFDTDDKYFMVEDPVSYRVIEITTGNIIFEKNKVYELLNLNFTQDLMYALETSCEDFDHTNICIRLSNRVWDVTSGKENFNISLLANNTSATLSPKGNYLLTQSGDDMQLWDINTNKQIALAINQQRSIPLFFSPNENYIVIRHCNGTTNIVTCPSDLVIDKILEISTGREIPLVESDVPIYFEYPEIISPNGNHIALQSADGRTVYIKDTQTGFDTTVITSKSEINFVFSSDSQYIAVTDCDIYTTICEISEIRVLKTRDGSEVFSTITDSDFYDFAISPNNKYLALSDRENVTVWDITTQREVFRGTPNAILYDLSFSSNSKYIFSSNHDYLLPFQAEDIIIDACARILTVLTEIEWKQYLGSLGVQTPICNNTPEFKPSASHVIQSRGNIVSPLLEAIIKFNLININTASLEELVSLGINPTVSQRIIDYRIANGPFLVIEDLINVAGIGPGTFERIKDLITVD